MQGIGKVLPDLGDIYYGGNVSAGFDADGEANHHCDSGSEAKTAAPTAMSRAPDLDTVVVEIRQGEVMPNLQTVADLLEDAASSLGTDTLAETADLQSVQGAAVADESPQDAVQASTQALRLQMDRYREMVDAAQRAAAIANKYGQSWSQWIPRLGGDPKGAKIILVAEEIVSLVRQMVEIIHSTSSIVFGNYSLPHASAIASNGLECFLRTEESRCCAMSFAKVVAVLRYTC